MKKHLLIGASLLALGITTTAIYAQVTGTSVVDKMKAVAHSFTLAATLNPSDSGLTSDPVKWKKSGDILTAGEYNRLLELVSEGGSSSGSVNYMQLTTPASVTFVEGGKVPFTTVVSQKGDKITQNGGEITLKGGSSYVISADIRLTSANSALWYTIINKSDWTGVGVYGANYTGVYTDSWAATSAIGFVSPTVDTTYFVRTASMSWAPISNHTGGNFTVWELGGGGGSGPSSGSGSGWTDVPLTDTSDFDVSCEYRFQMSSPFIDGNWSFGSPTPVGNHYYYATYVANNMIAASGTYNVMHGIPKGTKNRVFLYWLHGTGIDSWATTKIEKLCGGGSSSGTASVYTKCTNAQSLDSTNVPCYSASRNTGAGTDQYRVVSCTIDDGVRTYTGASILNFNNLVANKWAISINGGTLQCVDGSILVAKIQ